MERIKKKNRTICFYAIESTSVARDADPINIGIYKITSPSNRVYIGQSTNFKKRLNFYKNKNCKKQPKLFYSFNKYGVHTHIFEIIENCEIGELNKRERYWQEYYDCVETGLNCMYQKTDELPRIYSKETRNKISNTLKEKYISGEIISKVPKFSQIYTKQELVDKFGKRKNKECSEKTKQKMKNSSKKGKENLQSKKVINILTSEKFETMTSAWESIENPDYSYTYFCQLLSNKRKNKTNFIYDK